MPVTPGTSLPILFSPSTRRIPADLEHLNLGELRKRARYWLDAGQGKLPRETLVPKLRQALEDDAAAARVLRSLSPPDRAVAAVYRRYGGSVDGEVIRIDLLARGLLEIVEKRFSDYYTRRDWKRDPIRTLSDRWVLLSEGRGRSYEYSSFGYGSGPDKSFPRYELHAGIARHVEPAGPAPWSIPAATGVPQAVARRAPAEVALDLSRVFAHVAGRGSVKVRKDGALAVPTLRALEKAVPLDDGSDFVLPDPHGLYCELLRYLGVLQVQDGELLADPAAATRRFAQPGFWQVDSWARGWLWARHWFDGGGIPEGREIEESAGRVRTGRQVLAWALGGLAGAGDRWYELDTFLSALQAFQRPHGFSLPYGTPAWDPELAGARDKEKASGEARQRAWWFSKEGAWYANAVMVTLVALGLVERTRLGRGAAAPHGFRLTEAGRSVFGAPEVAPPPEPAESRCLVIQPNFEIVAYLDQADARTAGLLGRIAESGSAHSGPIQTFRLTPTSVYHAEESGLGHAQIVDLLRGHGRNELPANVLRSLADWSGKRESLSLRSGVTVLGFPTAADRDAYLKRRAGASCGDRFVLAPGPETEKGGPRIAGALVSDHLRGGRRTLELDEQGRIRATQPVDLVQGARLRRIARPTATGWQLTADSMRRAAAGGLKPWLIQQWLADHLAHATPPLIDLAIDAWLGKGRPLELADAVLLHVPDAEAFQAIATSRHLRPFLLGRPGPGWLIVQREARKELAAALEELGFPVIRELTHDELPAARKPAGADPQDGT